MTKYGEPIQDPYLLSQLDSGNNLQSPKNIQYGEPINDPDLLKELNAQKEPYLKSLGMAPLRIGADLGTAISNFIPKIPSYLSKGWQEVSALPELISQHPLHAAGQVLAGFPEAVGELLNIPANIEEYKTKRLNLPPIGSMLGKYGGQPVRPPDLSAGATKVFGEPKYPGEKFLRGIVRNSPSIYGISKLTPKSFLTSKKSIENIMLNAHDILENKAISGFDTVTKEAINRNLPPVPISPLLMNELKTGNYFPKTREAEKLLNDASLGDYSALRKVQSDLRTEGNKNLSSDLESERLRGKKRFEMRKDINDAISNHLIGTGNVDLNNILNQSRNDFRILQEIYYNENLPNSIKKMVSKEPREIPENLSDILMKRSNPIQRLKEFHPGLEEKLKGLQKKEYLINALKKYGIPTTITGLGIYGYNKFNKQ